MDIVDLIKELAEAGEAKIEVSLRLVREEAPARSRRPYDRSGRLEGYRGIASFIGTSVNYAMKIARGGQIPTYSIGRKIYAYEDEVMDALAADGVKTSTIRGILKRHGLETEKVERVCARR